jgi:hypothetical protein
VIRGRRHFKPEHSVKDLKISETTDVLVNSRYLVIFVQPSLPLDPTARSLIYLSRVTVWLHNKEFLIIILQGHSDSVTVFNSVSGHLETNGRCIVLTRKV